MRAMVIILGVAVCGSGALAAQPSSSAVRTPDVGLAPSGEGRDVSLEAATDHGFYWEGANSEVYVEARIRATAPAANIATAAVRNLVLVVDRSGSMAGARLQALRGALAAVVDSLAERDTFAVVAFGSEVETVVPAQRRDQAGDVETIFAQLQPAGGAALYDALNQGAAQLRRYSGSTTINHLVLVTDGAPTKGPREPDDFYRLAEVFAREGITLSTIGIGDEFDEDLLAGLARAGNGRFRFVDEPAKLRDAMLADVAPLESAVARDAELTITFKPYCSEIMSHGWELATIEGGSVTYHFPHLFADQDLVVLASGRVRASSANGVLRDAIEVRLRWRSPDGVAHEATQRLHLRFLVDAAGIRESASASVFRTAARKTISEGMQDAIEQLDRGDFRRALRALRHARGDVRDLNANLNDEAITAMIRRLETYLADVEARGLNQLDRKILRSGSVQPVRDAHRRGRRGELKTHALPVPTSFPPAVALGGVRGRGRGTGWSVHRLYDTVRREFEEQSTRALREQRAQAQARIRTYTDEVRQAIIAELAGLHVDGLSQALRRWDESNEVIIGTFRWETAHGFLRDSVFPQGLANASDLPSLWTGFRSRDSTAPASVRAPVAGYGTNEYHLVDNPLFPADKLGYQDENLDILTYAGHPADPWAGWGGRLDEAAAPWVVWYQPGPDAPVRGCFVDAELVAGQLRNEFHDHRLAQLELVSAPDPGTDASPADTSLRESLPAHVLRVSPGELFREKQAGARFSALMVTLLLGGVVIGVAFLVNLSRREARDAERKTTFVSQVSHELRTPLTSIRMFADMLAAPGIPEEKRLKFAGIISRESARLGGLIERLLTFAAMEKGKSAGPLAPVDVTSVVRETVDEMEVALRTAGLRAETTLPESTVTVMTNRAALKQALLNLLDNAAKYARDGGVVRVRVASSADAVCVEVADLGPGIPRHLRREVFEPFVQGGGSLTDKPAGVGLGLSIARGLLGAAGGELELVSSVRGATFVIRLPRVPSP